MTKNNKLSVWNTFTWPRSTVAVIAATALASGVWLTAHSESNKGLVAHEWGTFTSLQAGDGQLLSWRPLETSHLPKFVYDWTKPGHGRAASFQVGGGKGSLVTLQRMETPVIYFYANEPQNVDLTVKFPHGYITEWFPQAHDIGPSTTPNPALTMMYIAPSKKVEANRNSLIHWTGQIVPRPSKEAESQVPVDESGNHYFAARETDSALINVRGETSLSAEFEKFLFYRGVGNFGTPLKVTMTNNVMTLSNNSKETLNHLFVLNVRDSSGNYFYVDHLTAGEKKEVPVDPAKTKTPVAKISKQISAEMNAALTREGLYPREAAAMVKTWDGSWFEEEGVRVLYVLPRSWTDETLPLTMTPQPRQLVRVMVGRAEVIAPDFEKLLIEALTKAKQGDTGARDHAKALLKQCGRFSDTILQRAMAQAQLQPGTLNVSQLLQPAVRNN